jgi:hypothetical protein
LIYDFIINNRSFANLRHLQGPGDTNYSQQSKAAAVTSISRDLLHLHLLLHLLLLMLSSDQRQHEQYKTRWTTKKPKTQNMFLKASNV